MILSDLAKSRAAPSVRTARHAVGILPVLSDVRQNACFVVMRVLAKILRCSPGSAPGTAAPIIMDEITIRYSNVVGNVSDAGS